MSRIRCPSEDWDTHCEQGERAMYPSDEELLKKLDAYGHLGYVVGFSDEWSEDNICDCPTVWEPGKPVDKPEYKDDACTKCGGRENRGDWLACFDYFVHTDPDGVTKVAYHVVVNSDSGGFIDTLDQGVVKADKAPHDIVYYWMDVGMSNDTAWTEQEYADAIKCDKRWRKDLADSIKAEEVKNEWA